jgi:hypothetical protein
MVQFHNLISPLLSMKVTRYSMQGSSAYGEVFDTAEDEFKCRIEPSKRRISTDTGDEKITSARLFCKGTQDINVGDKIVWDDGDEGAITYYVIGVDTIMGFNHISHKEVDLDLDSNG